MRKNGYVEPMFLKFTKFTLQMEKHFLFLDSTAFRAFTRPISNKIISHCRVPIRKRSYDIGNNKEKFCNRWIVTLIISFGLAFRYLSYKQCFVLLQARPVLPSIFWVLGKKNFPRNVKVNLQCSPMFKSFLCFFLFVCSVFLYLNIYLFTFLLFF